MLHIPSASVYFFLSSIMVFGNKYLLSTWEFDYPIALIILQSLLTLSMLHMFNDQFKLITVQSMFSKANIEQSLKYQFLTALFYSIHSITSLKALTGLNIPMYATFKRCGPLINLLLSYVLFEQKKSLSKGAEEYKTKINIAIVFMTGGAILAGFGHLKFDLNAYLYCGASVVFQALYLSFIQKCGETEKNSMQTFYYSNIMSLPLLLIPFLFTSEIPDLQLYTKNHDIQDPGFIGTFSFVLICGACLCFCQFWCTSKNTAVTTSVVGVLKSFIQTTLGMFMFNAKNEIGLLGFVGIVINLTFGVYYTYLKYMEKELKHSSSTAKLASKENKTQNEV